jgi:hypothetical protein
MVNLVMLTDDTRNPSDKRPAPITRGHRKLSRASRLLRSLRGIFAYIVAAMLLMTSVGHAQDVAFRWEERGLADGASIPPSLSASISGVTVTSSWTWVTNGGVTGQYVEFGSGSFGTHTGFMALGLDNSSTDPTDRFIINTTFSVPVQQLSFSILDVDQSSWDDFVEIYADFGAGLVNIKGTPYVTLGGSGVVADNESFGEGYEGNSSVPSNSAAGNVIVDFGTALVSAIRINYFSGNDGSSNPGGQVIGVSDFEALPQSVWWNGSILARNNSGPARPYMARLRVFRRLI